MKDWRNIDLLEEIIIGMIAASIRLVTPLILAGVGELLVERGGILNLSVEGMMLIGAFAGFVVTYFFGDPWLGVLIAALSGLALALLFGLLTVTFSLDQVVSGLAFNLVSIGATSYIYRATFGWYVSPVPPHVNILITDVRLPILSDLPIVGSALFTHNPFTYLAVVFILLSAYLLSKTTWGLNIRATGEDPLIAEYLGIGTYRIRYVLLALEGTLAGVAGSLLSVSQYNMFLDNMTMGRGYIVIALIILGRWMPGRFLAAGALFAFIDALQLRIQASGITWFPHQFALMLPYLTTLLALLLVGRRVKGPAGLGKPYKRVR